MPLIDTKPDALAQTYARSLFELADEAGGQTRIESILGELDTLVELARSDAQFNEFLASRTLAASERSSSIERMFRSRLDDFTTNFLLVLNRKGRIGHIIPIVSALDAMVQERFGRVEVDVYTPSAISAGDLAAIRAQISAALGREAVVHPYTDASMIGGVSIVIGDQLIDGSVATQLRKMRDRLETDGTSSLRSKAANLFDGAVKEDWGDEERAAAPSSAGAARPAAAATPAAVSSGPIPSAPNRSKTPNSTGKKSVDQVDVRGKRVLIRVDFNVPLSGSTVSDDRRIREAIPTIKSVIDRGGRAVLMSHLGRPEGKGFEAAYSLRPAAEHLARLIGRPVAFPSNDCTDATSDAAVNSMKDGDVLLLENLRFHAGEKKGDANFASKLASFGDVYVNDAFGTCHREDASMVALPRSMGAKPKAIGFLVEKEVTFLSRAIASPKAPFVVVLGGAKVSDKIATIERLLPQCDALLIGGAMAYTFLAALGRSVGDSKVEKENIAVAKRLIEQAAQTKCDLHLPEDHVCSTVFAESGGQIHVFNESIPAGYMGLDIGPKTQSVYTRILREANTIVWNGPMGVSEWIPFRVGTRQVAEAMADATKRGATTIVGGGDSAEAIHRFNLSESVSHVSTGGGASIEMLEGKRFASLDVIDMG